MKKITLLLLALVLVASSMNANPVKGKKKGSNGTGGYYSFSLGPSLPMGDYASTEISNTSAAAKMGLHINLVNLGFTFTPNIGVAALVCLGANKFDAEKLFGSDDKDPYWVYGGLMVGPLVTVNAGEKISLDFRPVVGLAYVAAPEVNEGGGSSTVLVKSDQATGFGFDIGASMRYHANSNLDLGLNLDYFSAKPSFKDSYDGFEGSVSTLGITAGFAFRF